MHARKYIRAFSYSAGPSPTPVQGAVACISARKDGYLELDAIWATGSKITEDDLRLPSIFRFTEDKITPTTGFATVPMLGDRYVLCDDTRMWDKGDTHVYKHVCPLCVGSMPACVAQVRVVAISLHGIILQPTINTKQALNLLAHLELMDDLFRRSNKTI